MLGPNAVITSVGCDYITAYADSPKPVVGLHGLASQLFRHQSELGNKHAGFGLSGFKGYKCGEVEIGERGKEVLVRLHGQAAAHNWRRVVHLADNVSRFDVQVTIKISSSVTDAIDEIREAAELYATAHSNKPIVRWVRDHRGGYTLYLGARSSRAFARVYDKHQKTPEDFYKESVRVEVQYQDHAALLVAGSLSADASPLPRMGGYVQKFVQARGYPLELPGIEEASIRCPRSQSDVARNLRWLEAAVRPCVRRLIDAGKGVEVLTALGLVDNPTRDTAK